MKKKGIRLVLALFLAGLCYVVWQYHSIETYADALQPVHADAILIPGAEVRGTEPSPALRERLDMALHLYQQGYARHLILSGGHGSGEISEAECMRRYLEKNGVPHDALLLEDQSHDTRENLQNSKKVLEAKNLHTVLIATHRFHQKRAHLLAEQVGLDAVGGYSEPSHAMIESYWTLRETLAMIKAYIGN
ncbi:YdcF family protein [Tumebacillus flagellatus]|uniref:DUF218 domain-containing protein n=1 Tax=Tumebacillus flagellatus TaxID=1157490 RepID=A0A074LNH6_9BACL|nr:YdcF family protein [Tumebacillus flagellatus]KEO82629.1 hypothetical protein EL26_14690 [Tumebacillus flagellatus]